MLRGRFVMDKVRFGIRLVVLVLLYIPMVVVGVIAGAVLDLMSRRVRL